MNEMQREFLRQLGGKGDRNYLHIVLCRREFDRAWWSDTRLRRVHPLALEYFSHIDIATHCAGRLYAKTFRN